AEHNPLPAPAAFTGPPRRARLEPKFPPFPPARWTSPRSVPYWWGNRTGETSKRHVVIVHIGKTPTHRFRRNVDGGGVSRLVSGVGRDRSAADLGGPSGMGGNGAPAAGAGTARSVGSSPRRAPARRMGGLSGHTGDAAGSPRAHPRRRGVRFFRPRPHPEE